MKIQTLTHAHPSLVTSYFLPSKAINMHKRKQKEKKKKRKLD